MRNKGGISGLFILALILISVLLVVVIIIVINRITPKDAAPDHNDRKITDSYAFTHVKKWSSAPPQTSEQIKQMIYDREHPAKPTDLKSVVIKQIQQVSMDGCRVEQEINSIIIKGDGSVIYEDMTDPAHPLKKSFKISDNDIKELLDLFYKIDFFSLPDKQAAPSCMTGSHSTVYSLTVNSSFIKEYKLPDNAPNNFVEIQNILNNIVAKGLPGAQVQPMQLISAENKQRINAILFAFKDRAIDRNDAEKILDVIQQPYALVEHCESLVDYLLSTARMTPRLATQIKDNCKN